MGKIILVTPDDFEVFCREKGNIVGVVSEFSQVMNYEDILRIIPRDVIIKEYQRKKKLKAKLSHLGLKNVKENDICFSSYDDLNTYKMMSEIINVDYSSSMASYYPNIPHFIKFLNNEEKWNPVKIKINDKWDFLKKIIEMKKKTDLFFPNIMSKSLWEEDFCESVQNRGPFERTFYFRDVNVAMQMKLTFG